MKGVDRRQLRPGDVLGGEDEQGTAKSRVR
jgi:hypothetical protein